MSNSITFDPRCPQNGRNWRNEIFGQFSTVFFYQKGCQMLSHLNFETRCEIRQGALLNHKMEGIRKLCFCPNKNFKNWVEQGTIQFLKRYHWTGKTSKNHISPNLVNFEKKLKSGTP